MSSLRSPLLPGSVLALTALALLFSLLLRPWLAPNFSLLFFASVWLNAWYHGRVGGLLATGASAAVLFLLLRLLPPVSATSNLAVRLVAFVVIAVAVTWATASWHDSRTLLASTLASIGEAVLVTDVKGRITYMNPVAETLTGWPATETRGRNVGEVMRLLDEQTHQIIGNPLLKALRERVTVDGDSHTALVSRSGTELPVEHSAAPVRDPSGVVRGGILVFRDVSARRQLEDQVTHAQKMDAVGRLAGGAAGDFNNVLTVIAGYSELLRAELPPAGNPRRFIDEIAHAAERATALSRRLLAFSGGPAAQPGVLDLNALIVNMEPMLRRLLGDRIELVILTTPRLGRVSADAGQIEQSILNLLSNARDAMPGGGKVVIETSNVDLGDAAAAGKLSLRPDSYVMLAVSDTGVGMDSETRARLFEPFFTTKEPGKGSGLGLATVYGTVKQSGGQVTVYSQPACGTIFEIYLPRAREVAAPVIRKTSPKGSETVLLVEDEAGVRKLVGEVLKSNGYDVLEADNGNSALLVYEKNAHKINLVLADVVMPQMNGFELVKELAGRNPGIKVLYMSGYRDSPVTSDGEPPRAFLHKPFAPDTLLAKVREVLDSEFA